jgi:hypothetical protein
MEQKLVGDYRVHDSIIKNIESEEKGDAHFYIVCKDVKVRSC